MRGQEKKQTSMQRARLGAQLFTRNRERLLEHELAAKFFYAVVEQAKRERQTSSEHFTVDGTLIEAWASISRSTRPMATLSGATLWRCSSESLGLGESRTTRTAGYLISQRKRKLVEEIFGWGKTVGNFRKTRLVGLAKE